MIYLAAFWSSATLITYNIAKYKSNPYLHKPGLAKEDWKKSQTKRGKKIVCVVWKEVQSFN